MLGKLDKVIKHNQVAVFVVFGSQVDNLNRFISLLQVILKAHKICWHVPEASKIYTLIKVMSGNDSIKSLRLTASSFGHTCNKDVVEKSWRKWVYRINIYTVKRDSTSIRAFPVPLLRVYWLHVCLLMCNPASLFWYPDCFLRARLISDEDPMPEFNTSFKTPIFHCSTTHFPGPRAVPPVR